MQMVYNLIRFEPRNLRHKSLIETTQELLSD